MAKKVPKSKQGRDRIPNYKKKGKDRNPKREAFWKKMNRIRKIMFWTLGIILAILALLVALTAIYEDSIGKKILQEVNKSLKSPIEVKEMNLNLIKGFPNASINFKEIRVPDEYSATLLRAQELSFKFNVLSIFGKTFKVKSLVINDGLLKIKKDQRGNANYDIFKPTKKTTDSDSETNISIDLKKTVFQNIVLKYDDLLQKQSADINLEYLSLSGNFSNQKTVLKTSAEVLSNYIIINGDSFLPNAIVAWDFDVDADFENGIYKLKDAQLDLAANTFKATGLVEKEGDFNNIDIALRGDDCTITSVIALLPDRYKNGIRDFNSKGNFYFNVDVNGQYGKSKFPGVTAEFGLKKGQITSPRLGESLKDVSFAASFVSKQDQDSAVFNMPGFVATLDKKILNIDLKVEDVNNPLIDFRFNGDVNLGLVYKLYNSPYIKDGSGLIEVQDLVFNGRYKDMITPSRLPNVDASGTISTKNFMIKYKDEPFKMQDGYMSFTNELLTVRSLKLFGADSDFLLNMNLYNVLPVVLADSMNNINAKLTFNGELESNNINFDKLLELGLTESETLPENPKMPDPKNPKDEEVQGNGEMDYTSAVQGRFKATVKQFRFRKVKGKNFEGTVEYADKEVIFKNVGVDVMDGKIRITSNLRLVGAPRLEAFIECDDIDGERFFVETENFGQKVLTDKNIKGRLDTKIIINAFWDKKQTFLYDKLYALMDLTFREGELRDFEMLKSFSQFIKIEDLEDIKFTDMRNQLRIQNNVLTIPTMFLQSNALNLTLAGQYNFNNDVDFKFKVNAGQIIANKFKRFNPRRSPKKARRNGWFNIYVGMNGNLYKTGKDGLQFDYTDKKDALAVLEGKLKVEFEDIQNTIQTKFNTSTVLEPSDWNDGDGNGGDDGDFEF